MQTHRKLEHRQAERRKGDYHEGIISAVGAIWLLYLLDYNMGVAVWVGLIALLGVDAETGMFMLLYLDLA